MLFMRRSFYVAVALVVLAVAVPAAAKIIEVGQTPDTPPPSCPGTTCRTVTRTTGFLTRAGALTAPVTATENGWVVALTLRLGAPDANQIKFFNTTYGGPSRVAVTILSPKKSLHFRVVSQSEQYYLQPVFGQTVQIALHTSLRIRKGQVAAITVPTWAPLLAVNLGGASSWRASRGTGKCNDFSTQTAQTTVGADAQYRCLYSTARLTYSVTEISDANPRATVVPPSATTPTTTTPTKTTP
jgi:hypothetical protein